MSDESPARPDQASDGERCDGRSAGAESPLRARAAFLANWDWESVIRLNRGACERGRAQHGTNRETHGQVATEWGLRHKNIAGLIEVLDFLSACQRRTPFFFFNETTFTLLSREVCDPLFSGLQMHRRREVSYSVSRYVAGLVERNELEETVGIMCRSRIPKPGERVRTLRGSLSGMVLAEGLDGRIHWRPDGTAVQLISTPELLLQSHPGK
jgi:hypothetical protein